MSRLIQRVLAHLKRMTPLAAAGWLVRRAARLVWWELTFQLGRRLAERRRGPLRLVYLSGEPQTPGHRYRVLDYAEAARTLGAETSVIPSGDASRALDLFRLADVVVVWRTAWDAGVEAALAAARAGGARIAFDIDDLIFEPALAASDAIDGLRSQGVNKTAVRGVFAAKERTMLAAEVFTAPTQTLADRMTRHGGRPAVVLPNGFDAATLARSRAAAQAWTPDGLFRIGYAAGTRTHQRDLAEVTDAVAELLEQRPDARLVLFRAPKVEMVGLEEFPRLAARAAQVEWRPFGPLEDLPAELARFDVNLAPLQVGNDFSEAKSELKFFEAALVGVPTIASPTAPFRAAIESGRNGLLAATRAEWRDALFSLAEDPALRARLASAALADSLRLYGPEARVAHYRDWLARLVPDAELREPPR